MRKLLLLVSVLLVVSLAVFAQQPAAPAKASPEDLAAIKATALDYVDSYYEGDAARMERALHPDLAKRIARRDQKSGKDIQHMTAPELVAIIATGSGKNVPKEKQLRDVKILDVYGNAATVRADMVGWVDYMHIAKINGKWKIVNVLWELHPKP
jgi:hypothetical protein